MPIYTHVQEPESFINVDEIEYGVTDVEAHTDSDDPNHPPMAHLSFNGHMLLMDMDELVEVRELMLLLERQLWDTLRTLDGDKQPETDGDLH